ncbi:hypothetical protein MCHI_003519 [Candidatus Magnetoovum chiemensis]|nr:hypothetical protein MCHI_003519 [Candidatus Magnetoovum chiemensis]
MILAPNVHLLALNPVVFILAILSPMTSRFLPFTLIPLTAE